MPRLLAALFSLLFFLPSTLAFYPSTFIRTQPQNSVTLDLFGGKKPATPPGEQPAGGMGGMLGNAGGMMDQFKKVSCCLLLLLPSLSSPRKL